MMTLAEYLTENLALLEQADDALWETSLLYTKAALVLTGFSRDFPTREEWAKLVYPCAVKLAETMDASLALGKRVPGDPL